MSERWLKLDVRLPVTKAGYSDAELAAFVVILCRAATQPEPGTFESMPILRALMGKRARMVSRLLAHGDLIEQESGALTVAHWDEWQPADRTHAERQRRYRERQSGGNGVTSRVTPEPTSLVTPQRVDISDRLVTRPVTREEVEVDKEVEARDASRSEVFMGMKPKPGLHDGRHGRSCGVCLPAIEEAERLKGRKPWEV